jgi:hypothetical protein
LLLIDDADRSIERFNILDRLRIIAVATAIHESKAKQRKTTNYRSEEESVQLSLLAYHFDPTYQMTNNDRRQSLVRLDGATTK